MKTSTLREVILVTFTHAERSEGLSKDLISEKAQKLFLCSSVVVAQVNEVNLPIWSLHFQHFLMENFVPQSLIQNQHYKRLPPC